MMTKTVCKKSFAVVLALIMCLSALTGMKIPVSAAEKTDSAYLISFPRSDDVNYNAEWGHGVQEYMNGWNTQKSKYTSFYLVGSYDSNICYCIEPGVPLHANDQLTQKGEDFWENYPSQYNHTIQPYEIKQFIGRIMQYGYTGKVSMSWRSNNEGGDKLAQAAATQLLIWETVVGERDENFNKVSPNGKNAILDQISPNHPLRAKIISYYNSIAENVQKHSKLPSFFAKAPNKAQNIELEWNGSEYTAVLTDSNNVLGNYTFSSNQSQISFSVSGNKLTISTKTAPSDTVAITADKKNSQRRGIITWSDSKIGPNGEIQDLVTYTQSVSDPVKGFLNVKVSNGSAKIVKTSEDGKIEGIRFHISGNGVDKDVVSGKNGEILVENLRPGIYTVTEQTYDQYEPQETRRVTVVSGQTATVTFSNTLKRGDLTVTKTSEDGLTEGVKFHLSGTSLSGLPVDEYAVTDSSGTAHFEDVLIGSGYVLSEVDTGIQYVVPDDQTATVEWNKVTEKAFHNILKKWNAVITKSDGETGTAQGDASLAGAVYGVYKGDQLIDTYTTDSSGQFVTKYYTCGSDWSIRELEPSEGYLLNPEIYHVGAEPELYEIEYNSTALDVLETVRKGKIAVIKHHDDGSTQIETPEQGATFEVYLKNAGSYENAKESERDLLVCDENGFAETRKLPYGVYAVKQTKGAEGTELMPAFDVFVNEDGEVYRYLINNATFEALIEIVKKDAETGKVIPAAGIGFKVKNADTGEWIIQHINYPTPMDIDTFYTDSTGKLMLPQALKYGNYELIEQCTAYGYVLSTEPVPFKVDGTQTVVTVEKYNVAQKGTITVSKSGEIFSSVTESDGIYQPVYAVSGLKGAVYEIYAAQDIVTLDGTVRAKKGDLVSTIETDLSGTAESGLLYLGKYKIVEKAAPYGMTLNLEPQLVELSYAGQEIELTASSAAFYNERQRVQIELSKVLEQDEAFGIGMNGEILSVQFALYAAEDLTAADGSVIPKDGLIEIVSCDENGKAVFTTDIPVGSSLYVKEYSTDKHYLISDKIYPVLFEYDGQDIETVYISINNGEAINNDLIRGSVIGKKVDEDGFAVCGAVFGLFKADETEFTEETALMTAEANEIGVFLFEDISYGTWLIRELKPAPAFVLNENVYPVTVSENEEVIKIEIENRFITGSVQTTKVDAEYPDNKLTGAVFEVYVDADGNQEFDPDIDRMVGEMNEIEDGVYQMDGLRYNGYFLYEKSSPEGFLKDENYHYFEIRNDGETVIVENEAGVGFVNQPITGELEITKKDISDGKLLPGVGFRIKNEQGEIVAEGYTDENGIAKFTLRYGKYTYQEFDPLDGYQPDETEYPFEIKEDGEIIKAEMTNERIPTPDIPQTGDDTNLGFFIGLGAIALGGLVASVIMYIKRKKDDDDE